MASQPLLHSKLITAAARDVLQPMGLFQKGRSRTWLDDHGWWVCVVEFQPSSWGRGSYLNVGCMWLWHEKDYVSFNEGHRVEPFSAFQDQDQFQAEAVRLATRAAEQVQHYRRLFPNIQRVCEFYLRQRTQPGGYWRNYDAGVACAIAGRPGDAIGFFDLFLEQRVDHPEWLVVEQEDAARLKALALNTQQFRAQAADRIRRTRELQKLPSLATVDFDREFSIGR